jgi:hypothetical protein
MERQKTRLPKKAKFSHPNSGLDNSKLPYLKTFRGEDMKNRRKGAIMDKSSPPPLHVNRTVQVRDALCFANASSS